MKCLCITCGTTETELKIIAMAKKITVNDKLLSKIRLILSMKLSLNDLEEFEEWDGNKLFVDSPESWREIENAICEYTNRMQMEIMDDVKKLLLEGNAR